jgi:cytochrome oxidase assembly protein ShyY1
LVLFVIVMAIACVFLARWQFHRLDERRAANASVATNEAQATLPAEQLADEARAGADVEWRRVTATGTYDSSDEVLARKRPFNGRVGYYVVTPLDTADGTVWTVRGWIPAGVDARTPSAVPPAPTGTVTVTGFARPWEVAGAESDLPPGQIARISEAALGSARLPFWIQVAEEQPSAVVDSLERVEVPDRGEGPHLSYALQWSAFALMALIGGVILLRRQREYFAEDRALAEAHRAAGDHPASEGD